MSANGNRISGSVGLDIAGFKANISELNRQAKLIESGFRAASDGTAEWGKSQEGLQAKIKALTEISDVQRKKIEELTAQYKKVSAEKGANSKAAQDLQIKINNETAALNKNNAELKAVQNELDNFGKETDEAGKKTNKSGSELKGAQKELDGYGNKAEDASEKTGKLGAAMGALGKAAAAGMAAVAAAGAAAVGALAKMSVSAAASADEIATISAQTGVTTDKIQEMQFASQLLDVELDTITKTMARNIRSMKDYQDGTAETVDSYDRLGVSILNADGTLRNGEDVYWDIIDALGSLENETERDAIAMQLLGRSAQDLNPLIKAGSDRMKELGKQANETGYVMSEDTLGSFNDLQDSLDYLSNSTTAAKNALGMVLMPMLKELADDGTDLLGDFAEGVKNANGDIGLIGDAIGGTLKTIVNKIIERLPEIIQLGKSIVSALGSSILSNLPQILSAAIDIMKMLVDGIVQNLPKLVDVAIQLLGQLATSLIEYIPELIPAAVEMILGLVQALVDNLPMLIDVAIDLILALVQGIINSLPIIIQEAPKIIKSLVEGIVSAIPQLIDAAIQIILTLVEFLTNPDNLDLLIQAAIECNIAFAVGLIQSIGEIVKAVPKIFSALFNAFKNMDWKSIGKSIIDGLIAGVKNAGPAFVDAVANLGKQAWNGMKDFFGIKSPSRLMRDSIGKNIGAGLALGITDTEKDVQSAMSALNGAIQLQPISAESRITAVDGVPVGRAQGGVNITLNQTNNSPKALSARDSYISMRKAQRDLKIELEGVYA